MKTLILASTSPRRREILSLFKIPFLQESPHFDEEAAEVFADPVKYATSLAVGKARSLRQRHPEALILGADTVVQKDGHYFSKPKDRDEAREFLLTFSDQWHIVVTGLALVHGDHVWIDHEIARVKFNPLSRDSIERYLDTPTWKDKAGGYGIMGASSLLVEQIEGSFYNVAGLPTNALHRLLLKGDISLWEHL